MDTDVTEIADGIYRLSTFVPEVGPTGFTFNQFLVDADEPLLFHTGPRGMFPLVSEAIVDRHAGRAAALDHVRAPRGRRVRRDEPVPRRRAERPGRARRARVHGVDQRPRRPPAPTARARRGARPRRASAIRNLDTPHVPHGWDAHVALRGDHRHAVLRRPACRRSGEGPALTGDDVVGAAAQAEDMFRRPASRPRPGRTIRTLAELAARNARDHARLVVRAATARRRSSRLADDYDRRIAEAA